MTIANKISAEEKFLELTEGMIITKCRNGNIFCYKDETCLFEEYNFFWFDVNYSHIWNIFETDYRMEYTDLQEFIRNQMYLIYQISVKKKYKSSRCYFL